MSTYEELERDLATLAWVETGTASLRSGAELDRVIHLAHRRLVSVYTDDRGVIRVRLKQAGRLALAAGLPSPGDGTRS